VSEVVLKKLPDSVTLSPEVLATPIGDSLMLLDVASGVYYELEGVGSRIWQLLAEQAAPADVARQIGVEYGVGEASAANDLVDLLEELSASGLLSYAGGPERSKAKGESADE
jgi:hypothetical protein